MRLHADDVPHPDKNVSIHASVKDATLPISRVVVPRLVSIHASVKDATISGLSVTPSDIVSIHASVKDATGDRQLSSAIEMFQSTHL